MKETDAPQIGKDVIESLTLGMYEDSRFIYREYIQNAADAIDKAVDMALIDKENNEIHVIIDKDKRLIVISDNATGIPSADVTSVLRNIAHSTKKRGEDKGFRGIGRLGGLGYCSKLSFETSFYGEPIKTTLLWDAEMLKFIINDRENKEEAVEVLRRVTQTITDKEDASAHYFRVTLEDVTSDELLDVENVTDYLSMVAPVDINSRFIFRTKINDFKKSHGLTVDTYNIFVNGDQIYKPYTSSIYEDNNGGKKKVDEIQDVDFLLQKDSNGNIIYWGWYTISGLKGQMKIKNIARGIRLRKENIQIGNEERCQDFFVNANDKRFSFYYFGEIHALSKGLIPNSRRDYFGDGKECKEFEALVKKDFLKLRELCYDMSKIRSSMNAIAKSEELRSRIQEKDKNGYSSTKEKADLHQQYEEQIKKEEQAKKQLANVSKKIENEESPLKSVVEKIKSETTSTTLTKPAPPVSIVVPIKTKFRTDKPEYSRYNKGEKKLIGKIYASIGNAIADEKLKEALISKIEEDITK